jgi:hypothetical protein
LLYSSAKGSRERAGFTAKQERMMAEKQYSLLEMIRVAQGFNREEGYTVLPNEVVKDIVDQLTKLEQTVTDAEKKTPNTGPLKDFWKKKEKEDESSNVS